MPPATCSPSTTARRRRPAATRGSASMPKRALVTGGAGFIGSHVAELYHEHGYEVTVVDNLSSGDRDNVPAAAEFHQLDITSPDAAALVREGAFDVISHLAAQIDVRKSVTDPLF